MLGKRTRNRHWLRRIGSPSIKYAACIAVFEASKLKPATAIQPCLRAALRETPQTNGHPLSLQLSLDLLLEIGCRELVFLHPFSFSLSCGFALLNREVPTVQATFVRSPSSVISSPALSPRYFLKFSSLPQFRSHQTLVKHQTKSALSLYRSTAPSDEPLIRLFVGQIPVPCTIPDAGSLIGSSYDTSQQREILPKQAISASSQPYEGPTREEWLLNDCFGRWPRDAGLCEVRWGDSRRWYDRQHHDE